MKKTLITRITGQESSYLAEFLLEKYYKNIDLMCSHINVGFGLDLSIKLLKNLIYKLIQYIGNIEFDMTEKYDEKKTFLITRKY